jgi:N-acetylglutamate synthase-like GNAT family acetyltransferase
MHIRPAGAEEADRLTSLALRAKAHWGYSEAFLAACRSELTYSPEAVGAGGFQVIEEDGAVRGFYALWKVSPTAMELDALFVDPDHLARGLGRRLLDHAKTACADAGMERLVIQADPNAAEFYEREGAERIGTRASESTGRQLPLYEVRIHR